VVVTHADGTEYRQSTNLLFTKIGEIGTNGTNTVLKINEKGNVPIDECLTIIKFDDMAYYNIYNSIGELTPVDTSHILEANLYTNNTQALGHTVQ